MVKNNNEDQLYEFEWHKIYVMVTKIIIIIIIIIIINVVLWAG